VHSWIREKRIFCGTQYMEVDIYPYTGTQQITGRQKRARKKKESAPKQRNLNDKNARRYLTQLTNTNFTDGDHHITVTYKDKYLPESIEEAEKEAAKYLRRISYRRKKDNLPPLKYIMVTECAMKAEKPIRIHHHIIVNRGLDRDTIEDMWSRRKKKGEKSGERIGYANADKLQPDENGLAALCTYLTKNPNGKKRWTSSQNLEKPESKTRDIRHSLRPWLRRWHHRAPLIRYVAVRYVLTPCTVITAVVI